MSYAWAYCKRLFQILYKESLEEYVWNRDAPLDQSKINFKGTTKGLKGGGLGKSCDGTTMNLNGIISGL